MKIRKEGSGNDNAGSEGNVASFWKCTFGMYKIYSLYINKKVNVKIKTIAKEK